MTHVLRSKRRVLTASTLILASIAACKGPGKSAPEQARPPATAESTQAPTVAPAPMSHGEASVGAVGTPAPISADAPPPTHSRVVHARFEVSNVSLTIDSGVTYAGWTFNGRTPGPVLRVTQGDTLDFTLVNRAPMPHSIDFHAAQIAPNRYYTNVAPGDSIHFRFPALVVGAFLYHCGTAPVAAHIANGMVGALIVDPVRPRTPAHEFVLVQSEFYAYAPTPASTRSLDWEKLLNQAPDFVVFNGRAAQYAKHPIPVRAGELLRLYVVNAGPNRISSFHVVGGIFERVYEDGSLTHPLEGVQTVNVPVGGAAIFEIRLREPGTYPFVTHAFADATKGAVGMFQASANN